MVIGLLPGARWGHNLHGLANLVPVSGFDGHGRAWRPAVSSPAKSYISDFAQQLLDVLLEYQIRSDRTAFTIDLCVEYGAALHAAWRVPLCRNRNTAAGKRHGPCE
jgi:hypothetical protein